MTGTHPTPTDFNPRWQRTQAALPSTSLTVRALLHYFDDICQCSEEPTIDIFERIGAELSRTGGRSTRRLFVLLRELNQHLVSAHD